MPQRLPPKRNVKKTTIVASTDHRHRGPIGKAKILTPDQFDRACAKAIERSFYGDRDRIMIMLSRFCGMRAMEIAGLHFEDITDAEGKFMDKLTVTKRATKGSKTYGKERVLLMRPELRSALNDYVKKAEITGGPIFYTRDGVPMTSNAVQKQLKATYEACGFKGARSHTGRRYAITTMAQNANTVNASLEDVKVWAGHSSLTTTATYIDQSPRAKDLIGFL
jgi:integrase/recombinase XerD